MGWTLAARGPFGLSTTSNLTLSPSLRVRKPSDRISEWWTKTSGPPSRDRKPKPLDSLNHLTVPSIMNVGPPWPALAAVSSVRPRKKPPQWRLHQSRETPRQPTDLDHTRVRPA